MADDHDDEIDDDVEPLEPSIMMGEPAASRTPGTVSPFAVSRKGTLTVEPPSSYLPKYQQRHATDEPESSPSSTKDERAPAPSSPSHGQPAAEAKTPEAKTAEAKVADAKVAETKAADEAASEERAYEALRISKVTGIGLLGGKGVGKSYLFQAMVYRTSGKDTGALASYLDKERTSLYKRRHIADVARRSAEPFKYIRREEFIDEFRQWKRLEPTTLTYQAWYRLHLPYSTGLWGGSKSEIQVRFFDGSGEHLGGAFDVQDQILWKEAFVDATVLVLCLPMWAAFPNVSMLDERQWFTYDESDKKRPRDGDLGKEVWIERETKLQEFHAVVGNYEQARLRAGAKHQVQVIVALTQADSPVSDDRVRDNWIIPYIRNHQRYLRLLQTGRGVARYLASAREMSRYLAELCAGSDVKEVSDLLNLNFGRGLPWFVPVTAIEGQQLDKLDLKHRKESPAGTRPERRSRTSAPVPAHVELPLLIALCEQCNALA